MTYEKPEVAVLGEASRLIEGSKSIRGENNTLQVPAECEFGD